jgi:hypothetical protein
VGVVTGSAGALHNDPVTRPSRGVRGGRRRTPARPTFPLSAAPPAATDTEESRVHLPAFLRTHPVPGDCPVASSQLRLPVRAGLR